MVATFHERTDGLEPGDVLIKDGEQVEVEELHPIGPGKLATYRVQVRRVGLEDTEDMRPPVYDFYCGPQAMQVVVGE